MPSLLLVVFLVQLAIHLVNTVGASAINVLAWNLYQKLPTPQAQSFREKKKMQTEYAALVKQLNATSPQNEFSKWAKLDRQHNKLREQLEKKNKSLESNKANFDKAVTAARWLLTNGLRMFLQFWFSKQAMFWLPHGFVPYYGEWLLSFPRAPLGSISIQTWALACGAAILLASDLIVAVYDLIMAKKNAQKVPMKMAGQTAAGEKKEL